MPDYALEHVFSRFGAIDFVRLQSDARHGVVQFVTAEAAAAALAGLTGTDICGQVCSRPSACSSYDAHVCAARMRRTVTQPHDEPTSCCSKLLLIAVCAQCRR